MKRIGLLAGLMLSVAVCGAAPKEEVIAAAKKLAEAPNYTWKTTIAVPEGQFGGGSSDGKADKDGTVLLTQTRRDTMTETVIKGEKAAMTNRDGDWESLSEVEANTEGFGRFRAAMVRNFKAPATQAQDLANAAKELKKDGDVISGELTEEGAKQFMSFGGRRGGGGAEGPTVNKAAGSVKFWVKDGVLTKYEYKVKGSINFGGEDRDVDRTSTTEISKVGETKIVVPEAAKKKLS
jgi:hypothetical protein